MHKRILFINPNTKKPFIINPHEIAEAEEKDAFDWGNVSEKDTSFEAKHHESKGPCCKTKVPVQ